MPGSYVPVLLTVQWGVALRSAFYRGRENIYEWSSALTLITDGHTKTDQQMSAAIFSVFLQFINYNVIKLYIYRLLVHKKSNKYWQFWSIDIWLPLQKEFSDDQTWCFLLWGLSQQKPAYKIKHQQQYTAFFCVLWHILLLKQWK